MQASRAGEYSLPVFWGFFMLTGIALFSSAVKSAMRRGHSACPVSRWCGNFRAHRAYLLYSSLAYHRTHRSWGSGARRGAAVMLFPDGLRFPGRSRDEGGRSAVLP